jgi:YfiH family protein
VAAVTFTSQEWGNFGLLVGEDEVSVLRRRHQLSEKLSLRKVVFMRQTHSAEVVEVSVEDDLVDADGIITKSKYIGVAVLAADCIPLLLESEEYVGAIHIGRVGMEKNIATRAIEMLRARGAQEISALIGPSVCGDCYEVSPEMYLEVSSKIPSSATTIDSNCLDIKRAVCSELENLGVTVADSGICTMESPEFFSHRISQKHSTPEGRGVGVISR